MSIELAVRWIGISHLLQPPLTLLLASRLGLRPAFDELPPLPRQVARNMAVAAVALPTSLGIFIALHAADAASGGATWSLAVLAAAFWSWRLERQLRAVGPLFGARGRFLHPILVMIFTLQGPLLGSLLILAQLDA